MAIKNNFINIIIICAFFGVAGFLNKDISKPNFKVSKQESALNVSHELLNIFDLGQRRLFSDILWITTLLESDLEHYRGDDLNSWLYLRFNTISVLDPLFLKNYQFGGQYLSIVKDDLLGAEKILKKGIDYYPKDFDINFSYGFLLAFELGEYEEAIKVYENLLKLPNPPGYLKSLIIKLKHQSVGDLDLTFKLLEEQIKNTKTSIVKEKLKYDAYAIKATKDLRCLNNGQKDCETLDYESKPYIFRSGKWVAQKEFNEYKLHLKRK